MHSNLQANNNLFFRLFSCLMISFANVVILIILLIFVEFIGLNVKNICQFEKYTILLHLIFGRMSGSRILIGVLLRFFLMKDLLGKKIIDMKKTYLLPTYFRKIGLVLTVLVLLCYCFGLDCDYYTYGFFGYDTDLNAKWFCKTQTSLVTTVYPVLLIIGLSFIAFSRNKVEDEYIVKIREQAFVWSMFVGYVFVILITLFIYGPMYIYLSLYDIYIFLVVFICRFNYQMYKFKKTYRNEE